MTRYEYKVLPAPEKARKVRGLKGPALFAHALEEMMNELGAEGWDYVRADTLPQEERSGLTSKTTTYRNVLVFRRAIAEDDVTEPAPVAPQPEEVEEAEPVPEAEDDELQNLWADTGAEGEDTPADSDADAPRALFPNRQR